ncbi:MAG: hypothetical protein OEM51_10780 [Gammaproteobacteria bacterium]|nr:hypothetical protein [Gammaproteobacteria bacterium]MDH3431442.1 hypothetical protein [Gammaproteobacteria bacterium]
MPAYLEPRDVSKELADFNSVLIVSCPVCPPMCLAMQTNSPFIELFRRGMKTGAFEEYIQSIREPLERRGVRTDAFSMHAPTPMMCIWTESQRNRLRKRARDYEAVVVLGCDSGTVTAVDALRDTDCKVIQAMEMNGIMNATASIRLPLTVTLEPHIESKVEFTILPKTGAGESRGTEHAAP